MAFDYAGAREAGYSDQDIANFLAPKLNFNLESALSAGYNYSDIAANLVSTSESQDTSMFREALDVPILAGQGATQLIRMGTQAFGADNPVANTLMGVEDYLGSLISAASRNQQEEIAQIFADAEGKGFGAQVKAGLKALTVAPADTLAQFGGTAVPFIAANILTGGAATPALALGATTGVGLVKGTIFDAVSNEYIKAGVDPEQAEQIATEAQAYMGDNIDQIALGGVLGAAAGRLGIERGISNLVTKNVGAGMSLPTGGRAIVGGALAESIPEAVQAGQEKFASNLARQRKGFDVDLMEGVVGQSVFEGGAGLVLGGGVGLRTSAANRQANRLRAEEQAELLKKKQEEEIAIQDSIGEVMAGDLDTTELPDDYAAVDLSLEPEPTPEPVPEPEPLPARDLDVKGIEEESIAIIRQTNPREPVSFVSEPTADGRGYQIKGSDGREYGAPVTEAEPARQLAFRLNERKNDQKITLAANESINRSGLSGADTSTLTNYRVIGSKVLNPRFNEVTAAEINFAADAATDESILEDRRRQAIQKLPLEQAEYYLTRSAPANRAKSNAEKMRLLTPVQRENLKRREKGLPEKSTFSMAEARRILGKNFGNLADPQADITPEVEYLASISSTSIPISRREKGSPKKARTLLNQGVYKFAEGAPAEVSLDTLGELLEEKNIASSIKSKEMKPLIKAFTGAGSYKTMNAGDRRVLYQKINMFSDFAQPVKLPNFEVDVSAEEAVTPSDAESQLVEEETLALPSPEIEVEESPRESGVAADESRRTVTDPEMTQSQAASEVANAQQAALRFLRGTGMAEGFAEVVASQAGGSEGSNFVNGTQEPTQTDGWSKKNKFFDKIRFKAQDKYLDLFRAEEGIAAAAGLEAVPTLESAYTGIESISGMAGNEISKTQEQQIKPLLAKLNDLNIPREDFNDFLILRHAIERNDFVRKRNESVKGTNDYNPNLTDGGSGELNGERLTDAYVKQVMARDYGMQWDNQSGSWVGGNQLAADMLNAAQDFDALNQAALDDELNYGLISREEFKELSDKFKYYVPMKGKKQDPAAPLSRKEEIDQNARGAGGIQKLSTKGAEGKKIRGRTGSQAFDPLANAYSQRLSTIIRGLKNKQFGERLYNLVQNNPNPDYWEILGEGEKIPSGMTSIGVKIDGKQKDVLIYDKRLRDALTALDVDQSGAIVRILRRVNRFLSAVNTSYNPEFVISNFARDVQTALANVVGEQGMKGGKAKGIKGLKRAIIKDTLPSVGQVYKGLRGKKLSPENNKLWNTYLESGAKTDFFYAKSPAEIADDINVLDQMARGTFTGNVRKKWRAVTGLVEDANGAVENGVRFATFKKARQYLLDQGVSEQQADAQAATLAKNLTVNFNRKGNSGELLNALYLFFNASVQGTANFARGMSSRRKQGMMASMATFGALITYLNQAVSDEEEGTGRTYYDNIPDYEKERNLIIMKNLFDPEADPKDYWKIPLPYGYNVLHLIGLNSAEVLSGEKSGIQAASDLTSAAIGSFSPVGFSSSENKALIAFKGATPQIVKPAVEAFFNENHFGAPIYREDFPFAPPTPASSRSMRSTPEFLKNTFEFLNEMTIGPFEGGNLQQSGPIDISPDIANHLLTQFTGAAGTTAKRTGQLIAKLQSGEEIETREIPFIRKIMGEANLMESQGDYYDRRDDIRQVINRLDNLRGPDRVQFRRDNLSVIRMNSRMKSTDKRIRSLNKRLNEVRTQILETPDPALRLRLQDTEEKLQEQKESAIALFNRRYDEMVGRTE